MKNGKLTCLLLATLVSAGCSDVVNEASNPLRIPTLIDSQQNQDIQITLSKGKHQFYPGIDSETMGFNGSYLGPVIRLHKGSTANISFNNQLGETTTVHGHGLHVSGDIDGGPQLAIADDETWKIAIPVQQQAGMSWYHPHFMGKTAQHVHAGLAGIYLIEDENSSSLDLPARYGVNDIPLVVQDRHFIDGKMAPYQVTHEQMMDGLREDTLVVNGTLSPYQSVPQGWVRLRLLNGSNARFYRFFFENDAPFYKIATEGGFLNEPVALTSLTMSPGERNEIMVDMSELDSLHFMAEFLAAEPSFLDWFNPVHSVLQLKVDTQLTAQGILPTKLNNIVPFTDEQKKTAKHRRFRLEMEGNDGEMAMDMGGHHNMFSINGESMRMDLINEQVTKGEYEIWTISAEMMPHPFHVHGVSFQILSHDGKPPAAADRGWKDTIVVNNEPSQVMMRFDHVATPTHPYMYHCHILEHEDGGMMGQFTVQ